MKKRKFTTKCVPVASLNLKLNGNFVSFVLTLNYDNIHIFTCSLKRTKNEETIVKSERIEITETEEVYSLKIKKATMTDAGTYNLKISNRLGHETKSASLTVKCNILLNITFSMFILN